MVGTLRFAHPTVGEFRVANLRIFNHASIIRARHLREGDLID
jgi:hypothetical protein